MNEWNPRWIVDASIHSFNRRRRCAREDDERETRRRTGEEKIYSRVVESRARGRDASRDRRDERLTTATTVVRLLRGLEARAPRLIRFDSI